MKLNELSLKEKIGQRFIIGVYNNNIDYVVDLIKNYYIGGVILYKKNYNNYEELLDVVNRLKEANKNNKIPLIITIDQEWGIVNRMPKDINNIKNIYELSKCDENISYDVGLVTGEVLGTSGINMNLAPVVDIYNNSKSTALVKRCFYNNNSDNALKYINGLKESNVIPVCKHFPGHGITKHDSHFFLPYFFNYNKILEEHIIPFKNIMNDIDCLMIGHFIIRKLTGLKPASISKKFIDKFVREECKYDGVIMSDEINMISRNIIYRWNCFKNAINSNCDLILLKVKNVNQCTKLMNKINNMKFNEEELDLNVERIIKLKNKYKLNDDKINNKLNIDKVNKKIEKINNIINK